MRENFNQSCLTAPDARFRDVGVYSEPNERVTEGAVACTLTYDQPLWPASAVALRQSRCSQTARMLSGLSRHNQPFIWSRVAMTEQAMRANIRSQLCRRRARQKTDRLRCAPSRSALIRLGYRPAEPPFVRRASPHN